MSYNIDETSVTLETPEVCLLRINNSDNPLTTSSVIVFEDNITNVTHNGISSGLTITSSGLTLGPGHWQLQGFLAVDNDDDLGNNIEYQWYVGGTATGVVGSSEISAEINADSADCCVSVDSGTVDVELKIISANTTSGDLLIMEEFSPLVIWKVSK